jgi:hypothetical protein
MSLNPRLAALVLLPVLMHLHVGISVAGTTVTLSLPVVIPLVLIAAVLLGLLLAVRNLRDYGRAVT